MKITHVISDGNVGGAGILLSLISKGLCHEFENEIILPRGSLLKARLADSGAKITEFEMASDMSFSPSDIPRFVDYFKRSRPDIIHTHASLSARLAARLAGVKGCISQRHCAKEIGHIRRKNSLGLALYDYCTDLTISTADYATSNLIAEGIRKERIVTIKNGVTETPKITESEKKALRRSLSIPDDYYVIGSVARLEEVKGQDIIIRAHARLLEYMKVHLLIIGTGSKERSLKRLSDTLGGGKHTTFLGYVEKPYLYQNIFDININSSRGTETSCLANSECMSLGIPSCVSNFGGNPEQITHMENGLIFPVDDAFALEASIALLLGNPEIYKRLSLGARARYLKDFSLDRMARDYEEVYLRIKNIDNLG